MRVGPEGIEPTPAGLKVRCAACYTTTLCLVGRIRFNRRVSDIVQFLLFGVAVVALRAELSTTWLSAMFGQPALDCQSPQIGKVGLEPTLSCSQNTRACRCPTSRQSVRTAGFEPAISWPPATRDARLRYVLFEHPVGESNPIPTGIRSPSAVSAGRGVSCAHSEREVGLTVLEPVSPGLQPGALPSKLPAQQKNPMSLVTPGL